MLLGLLGLVRQGRVTRTAAPSDWRQGSTGPGRAGRRASLEMAFMTPAGPTCPRTRAAKDRQWLFCQFRSEHHMSSIQTVGIIGSGTMGNGIAQACAGSGIRVVMGDIAQVAVDKGLATLASRPDRLIKKDK